MLIDKAKGLLCRVLSRSAPECASSKRVRRLVRKSLPAAEQPRPTQFSVHRQPKWE